MIMTLIIKDTFPSQNPPSIFRERVVNCFVVEKKTIKYIYISIYEYELYNVTEKKVERY